MKNACIEGLEGVHRQLRAGLERNQVNLSENYQLWNMSSDDHDAEDGLSDGSGVFE